MATVLEVRDLRKVYDGTAAVDGVSFAVEAGEVFGILGPNGAGKSTTPEIIDALRRADAGRSPPGPPRRPAPATLPRPHPRERPRACLPGRAQHRPRPSLSPRGLGRRAPDAGRRQDGDP